MKVCENLADTNFSSPKVLKWKKQFHFFIWKIALRRNECKLNQRLNTSKRQPNKQMVKRAGRRSLPKQHKKQFKQQLTAITPKTTSIKKDLIFNPRIIWRKLRFFQFVYILSNFTKQNMWGSVQIWKEVLKTGRSIVPCSWKANNTDEKLNRETWMSRTILPYRKLYATSIYVYVISLSNRTVKPLDFLPTKKGLFFPFVIQTSY